MFQIINLNTSYRDLVRVCINPFRTQFAGCLNLRSLLLTKVKEHFVPPCSQKSMITQAKFHRYTVAEQLSGNNEIFTIPPRKHAA